MIREPTSKKPGMRGRLCLKCGTGHFSTQPCPADKGDAASKKKAAHELLLGQLKASVELGKVGK